LEDYSISNSDIKELKKISKKLEEIKEKYNIKEE